MAETETPEERARRLDIERTCAGIGRTIAAALDPGIGFALMMFDFGDKGSFAYMANADRDDFLRLLDEARAKIRGQ